MRGVALVLATSLGLGCKVTATFDCVESPQCGSGGTCQPNGLCSFADATCASGQRYGDYSGDLSGTCVGDEPGADAPVGGPDAACSTWQATYLDTCLLPVVTTPLVLEAGVGYTLDTTDGSLTPISPAPTTVVLDQPGGAQVRVVVVGDLTIADGASISVRGSLPAIFASWGAAAIGGTIDATSYPGLWDGAGASAALCPAAAGAVAVASGGSGGGGGGGFGGTGGNGGSGDSPLPIAGGPGGEPVARPPIVRAGCAGGPSGAGGPSAMPPSTPSTSAPGGAGGGGIAIVARGMISIGPLGRIVAGGAGGTGSPVGSSCGGGGGGAGGLVALDSRTGVLVEGTLAANGGGGGAGGSYTEAGGNGQPGGPTPTPADGGVPPNCATAGGRGASGDVLDGASVSGVLTCGGGGGGGAAGWIVIHTPVLTDPAARYSPPKVHVVQ